MLIQSQEIQKDICKSIQSEKEKAKNTKFVLQSYNTYDAVLNIIIIKINSQTNLNDAWNKLDVQFKHSPP